MKSINLRDIRIRTDWQPGDMGYVTYLHGKRYHEEYNFGIEFDRYVAEGLLEFHHQYNPAKNRVWVCEHQGRMVGFMLLMDRGEAAQLRYFIIEPEYRGIGLGKHLMDLFMEFLYAAGYQHAYLWTTHELHAAASLYTRHGFKRVEEKESDAFGKKVREVKYVFDV